MQIWCQKTLAHEWWDASWDQILLLNKQWLHTEQQQSQNIKNDQTDTFFFLSRYLIKFIWATALTLTIWDIPQLFLVTVTCLDHFVYLNVYFVQNKKANIIFFLYKKYKLI